MIEAVNVWKYYKSIPALKGVSFTIKQGITCIVGLNGAGKTTTLKLVAGILQPDRGKLLVDGKEPTQLDRRLIGYMPQEVFRYQFLTASQFVAYHLMARGFPAREAWRLAKNALELVGASELANRLLLQLSYGQLKLVFAAVALAGSPELIILDEPFAGLDPHHRHKLSEAIAKASRSSVVLLSSHELGFVEELCDHVIVLHRGRVVDQGAPGIVKGKYVRKVIRVRCVEQDCATKIVSAYGGKIAGRRTIVLPYDRTLLNQLLDLDNDCVEAVEVGYGSLEDILLLLERER